jgi:D-glycerate 3-kinase
MSPESRRSLASLAPVLLDHVPRSRPATLAIAGAPGSGKSTLARLLAFLLNESGRPTVVLSLDDYYLGRQQRALLARRHHPLLQQRGVPGTHHWQDLLRDLDTLRQGDAAALRIPVFDKSSDEPAPAGQWRAVPSSPSCLLLEGWCLGSPAQPASALVQPVNETERVHDPQGCWRGHVNEQLARYRADLQARVDGYWYLDVPGWQHVVDWRWRQEQELARPRLQSRDEVADFLATFQRIALHMQETSARWADWRLRCDALHRLEAIT